VLFPYVSVPVSVRNSPPPYFLPSFLLFLYRDYKQKSPAKKKQVFVNPRHSKGHKGMDDDNVQSVHEAALIVEQRPAQAQHQEHHHWSTSSGTTH